MSDMSIYMDFNATTPLDPEVIEEMVYAMQFLWFNPSSNYKDGVCVKIAIEKARAQVANMIKAKPNEIVFTSGGTESNNMVLHSIVDDFHKRFAKPPLIISSVFEHDSITKVLLKLERDNLIKWKRLSISPTTGTVCMDELISSLTEEVALVTVMLVNNETGIIQPIPSISAAIREYNNKNTGCNQVLLHTDAGQALGKIKVAVDDLGVDYLTIVGHKFYGPRIGALYVRDLQVDDKFKIPNPSIPIQSMFCGGGQERSLRSGTENTPMIMGLGKAAELVSLHIDKYCHHMKIMRDYLEKCLIEKFKMFGCQILSRFPDNTDCVSNTCNVALVTKFSVTGPDILSKCQRLQASVGAACHSVTTEKQKSHYQGSETLKQCGYSLSQCRSAVRLSVGRETSKSDVEAVVEDLYQAVLHFLPEI